MLDGQCCLVLPVMVWDNNRFETFKEDVTEAAVLVPVYANTFRC